MKILLNDQPLTVDDGCTVADLAQLRALPSSGVAIAVNDLLVPRGKWSEQTLADGDKVTVISAAYGG